MKRIILFAVALLLLPVGAMADDVAITVYNQNLAMVKEGRTLEFKQGVNELKLTDVAASIDATSVHFKPKSGSGEIELLGEHGHAPGRQQDGAATC